MEIRAEGMRVDLPRPWEGRITRNPARTTSISEAGDEGRLLPVMHAANFALPGALSDFGTTVVEQMAGGDCFVAVLDHGEQAADTALFDGPLPRAVQPQDFRPGAMPRTVDGVLGHQAFGTEGGRGWCLFMMITEETRGPSTVEINRVLQTLRLEA